MAVTLNANTSTGFIATSDTSGVLALQTAGTTAVSISASQVVTLTNALPVASGGSGVTTSTGTGANVLGTTPSFTSTIGVGGATASASGSGITFPATQSTSSDVNTLDDYEEGTFTPVPRFGGNNVGMVYTSSGKYTKVGNVVTTLVYFAITNKGSSTGGLTIGGLPFSTASYGGQGAWYSSSIYVQSGQISGLSGKWLTPNINGTGVDINYSDQSTGADAQANQGNTGTTGSVWMVCVYLTS